MAAKKSGAAKRKALKEKKQPKTGGRNRANEGDEVSGLGLSLADQARLGGKYEKFESLEERAKEVERVKRFIFANLMRTAVGMMKNAERGTNAAGAKLLWDFAEIDKLPAGLAAPAQAARADGAEADRAVAGPAVEEDPTKAVLSFYKKLGITPPKLMPPKPVEAADEEQLSAG